MSTGPKSFKADPSGRKLIQKIVRNDARAWLEFVDLYANLVFKFLWQITKGDQALSSRLFMEVMESLHEADATGRPFFRLHRYLATLDQFPQHRHKIRFISWLCLQAQRRLEAHLAQACLAMIVPHAPREPWASNSRAARM